MYLLKKKGIKKNCWEYFDVVLFLYLIGISQLDLPFQREKSKKVRKKLFIFEKIVWNLKFIWSFIFKFFELSSKSKNKWNTTIIMIFIYKIQNSVNKIQYNIFYLVI